MIEAVGDKYLNNYFRTIRKSLKINGKAAIQGIIINDDLFDRYRHSEDFIQKYIFPGGFLPSLNLIKKMTKDNQLNLEKINSYSEDYAKTLFTWRNNFINTWDNIAPLGFDDYFKRMWEFYLSYCEAGFKAKNIDLIQFSMSNR
jgi:cyclopropane-fatty-acyl-phospholipid synthase